MLAALVFLPLQRELFWNVLPERFRITYTPARDDLIEVLANLVLFVPVGALSRHGWRIRGASHPALATLITGAAIGSGIEIVQWGLGWRTASVQDALFNTAGTALGSALNSLLGSRRAAHSDS